MTSGSMVMVVDDDESVRTSLARLLRAARLSFAVFNSAEDFLTHVPPHASGCLIIDVQLPGLSGLDLQAQCARTKPGLLVIVMSAFDDDQIERKAIAAGAIAFLKKPFDCGVFLKLIERALAPAKP